MSAHKTGRGPNVLLNSVVFVVFVTLWLAFGAALLVSQATLDQIWEVIGGLPLVARGVVWLLLLPLVLGLWIWQADWSLWLRLALILGLAWANIYVFFPRWQRGTDRRRSIDRGA